MKKRRFAIIMVLMLFISICSNINVYAFDKVNVEDSNLKSVLLTILGKSDNYELKKSDMESITSISAQKRNIKSLKGLEYCSNLNTLDLDNNLITDVSPLSSLTKLEELWLRKNSISDISALKSLTSLQRLGLDKNELSNISPISSLTQLRTLGLTENKIYNISPLSSLKKLVYADVQDQKLNCETREFSNNIIIINPLINIDGSHLKAITGITYDGEFDEKSNYIKWPISLMNKSLGCSFYKELTAGLADVTFSGIINYGEEVELPAEQEELIKDKNLRKAILEKLGKPEGYRLTKEDLRKLEELKAISRDIKSIEGLEYCVNLKVLYLDDNKITDISSVKNLVNLRTLSILSNKISDITPVKDLVNLTFLKAADNNIEDISALTNLTKLKTISLFSNKITDVTALKNLKELQYLNLYDNKVENIDV